MLPAACGRRSSLHPPLVLQSGRLRGRKGPSATFLGPSGRPANEINSRRIDERKQPPLIMGAIWGPPTGEVRTQGK